MGLRRRFVLAVLALAGGGMACASVIGLNDFVIVNAPPDAGPEAGPDGGGETTVDGINVDPTTLVIPDGNCNESKSATFTITNSGNVPSSYSAALGTTAVFALQGADGTSNVAGYLAPGASTTVTAIATGPTIGTVTADVTITTGTTSLPVHLSYASHGSALAIEPATVDFGLVHDGIASAPVPVTFTNTGTDAVAVTGFTGANLDFTLPAGFTVAAGASVAPSFTMMAGTVATARASITPTTDHALCSTAPALTLNGQRTSQDVTVSPATVDLGDIPCGSANAPPSATITVSNYGGSGNSFDLGGSGQFTISPSSGSLAAATGPTTPGVQLLTVTTNAPSSNPATLSTPFTVTAEPSGTTTKIQATARIVGMVIQDQTSVNFQKAQGIVHIPIENTGNVTGCVTYQLSGTDAGYFTATPDTLEVNTPHTIDVTYIPGGADGGGGGSFGGGPGQTRRATITIVSVACLGAAAPVAFCQNVKTIDIEAR